MRYLILLAVSALFAIGLVMIFSTSSAEVLDHDLDASMHQAIFKQLMFVVVGGVGAFSLWRFGYHKFLSLSPFLLTLFSLFLLLALIPGVGREVNGSSRWIGVGALTFQPSEFVKYLIPAFFVYRMMLVEQFSIARFLVTLGIVSIPMGLILIEPNNGTVGVIGVSLIILFFLSRVPLKLWALPLIIFMMIGGVFAYNLPYVAGRLKVYWNPELDLLGRGHQPHQAKVAAGSGQAFGMGPGNSWQKLSFLPEAQNDYIAAIYAEEFGFVGMLGLITLYMLIAYFGYHIAMHAKDLKGFYVGGTITSLICLQAFLNLGVVSGLLPSTGLNLPFFSQGGSSLIANLMGIGLLLSVHGDNSEK